MRRVREVAKEATLEEDGNLSMMRPLNKGTVVLVSTKFKLACLRAALGEGKYGPDCNRRIGVEFSQDI